MKSEAEIRRHRDALAVGRAQPCDCPAQDHALECKIGGLNMAAAEAVLTWVLGEASERYENVVATVNSRADQSDPRRN